MLCLSFLMLRSQVLTTTHNMHRKNQGCSSLDWSDQQGILDACSSGMLTSKVHDKAVVMHVNLPAREGTMAWCCTQSCQGHTGPLLLAQSKAEHSHPPATPRQMRPPPSPDFTSALTQGEAYGVENKIMAGM